MAKSEKAILNETLIALTALPEAMFYRQNTGQAWQGRPIAARSGDYVRVTPGMKIIAEARPVTFGAPGGADIVGAVRGRAVQVELKALDGAQRSQQMLFEQAWVRAGGLYILARSANEAVERIGAAEG